MEVSVKVRRAVEGMYKNVIGTVRLNGKESGQFQMQRGIKQGDSLTLLLFIVYMNQIIEHCKRRTKRTVGNWKLRPVSIQATVYADDVVLIMEKEEELQTAVIEVKD
jgi:hypothetical protein